MVGLLHFASLLLAAIAFLSLTASTTSSMSSSPSPSRSSSSEPPSFMHEAHEFEQGNAPLQGKFEGIMYRKHASRAYIAGLPSSSAAKNGGSGSGHEPAGTAVQRVYQRRLRGRKSLLESMQQSSALPSWRRVHRTSGSASSPPAGASSSPRSSAVRPASPRRVGSPSGSASPQSTAA